MNTMIDGRLVCDPQRARKSGSGEPRRSSLCHCLLWGVVALLVLGGCGSTGAAAEPVRSPAGADTDVSLVDLIMPAEPETRSSPVTIANATAVAPAPMPYGVVYAYEKSDWGEDDRPAIRTRLEQLAGMGINTIVQTFSSRLVGTARAADWLILLDEAERAGIEVIARLWPLEEWDGHSEIAPEVAEFLAVVSGHPALRAYLGLHEPLEHYTSAQMRLFYTQLKALDATVPMAHYLADPAYFDDSLRFPNREFSSGICDLCIVWCTPARYLYGEPYLDETLLRQVVRENRALIDARSPQSELWFLGQTYALAAHRHQLRMPEPGEMDVIFRVAQSGGVDGFLWYPWLHSAYDQVLADRRSSDQRAAVATIAAAYLGQGADVAEPSPRTDD